MKADNDNGLGVRRPVAIPALSEQQQARFWMDVDRSGGPDACWPWTMATDPYGHVRIDGTLYLTHRVSFSIANGNGLDGDELVRHECDNPPCCNPARLVAGSYADNTMDMLVRGRANPQRGEDNVRAIANDNLVREIMASPLSGRKAAAHFGLSYGLVANIRAGRSWKHVANDNGGSLEVAA